MQEFVTALQENVHVTLEDTERIAQVNTKSKDLYKITDIINHFLSYFIYQILIALLMVFALIKDNVMAQLASVYVIKVLKGSIVKVTFERLNFTILKIICLNMTYFQINYALGVRFYTFSQIVSTYNATFITVITQPCHLSKKYKNTKLCSSALKLNTVAKPHSTFFPVNFCQKKVGN